MKTLLSGWDTRVAVGVSNTYVDLRSFKILDSSSVWWHSDCGLFGFELKSDSGDPGVPGVLGPGEWGLSELRLDRYSPNRWLLTGFVGLLLL